MAFKWRNRNSERNRNRGSFESSTQLNIQH
jgi:hypothetical protein